MDTNNNTASTARGAGGPFPRAEAKPCNFRNRGLTLATFVIALAGFASTAFSAEPPSEIFGQPGACIVSH